MKRFGCWDIATKKATHLDGFCLFSKRYQAVPVFRTPVVFLTPALVLAFEASLFVFLIFGLSSVFKEMAFSPPSFFSSFSLRLPEACKALYQLMSFRILLT